jgi:hypothetical protein
MVMLSFPVVASIVAILVGTSIVATVVPTAIESAKQTLVAGSG